MTSNAAVSSSEFGEPPPASVRTAPSSAFGALADTERFDQPLGKARVRRDERDDQPEHAHAIDVLLDENAVLGTVREVHHAHQLLVIDEREADERPRRE